MGKAMAMLQLPNFPSTPNQPEKERRSSVNLRYFIYFPVKSFIHPFIYGLIHTKIRVYYPDISVHMPKKLHIYYFINFWIINNQRVLFESWRKQHFTILCPRLGGEWIGRISWLPRAPLGPIFMTIHSAPSLGQSIVLQGATKSFRKKS